MKVDPIASSFKLDAPQVIQVPTQTLCSHSSVASLSTEWIKESLKSLLQWSKDLFAFLFPCFFPSLSKVRNFVEKRCNSCQNFDLLLRLQMSDLPRYLQARVSQASLSLFQERADASSMKFSKTELHRFSKSFLNSPLLTRNSEGSFLIYNKKSYEESAKEFLLSILDKAMGKK